MCRNHKIPCALISTDTVSNQWLSSRDHYTENYCSSLYVLIMHVEELKMYLSVFVSLLLLNQATVFTFYSSGFSVVFLDFISFSTRIICWPCSWHFQLVNNEVCLGTDCPAVPIRSSNLIFYCGATISPLTGQRKPLNSSGTTQWC